MSEKASPLEGRTENYITVDEAAEVLRVSRSTVYRWMVKGRLKFFRASAGSTRIPFAELKRFIEENTGTHRKEE